MKQKSREKRKKKGSAALAMLLSGALVIQSGLLVSAGEEEGLTIGGETEGDAAAFKAAETAVNIPAEQALEFPTETVAEQPAAVPAEAPAEQAPELPAETAAEQASEPPTETLAEQAPEPPTETLTEQAPEPPTEALTEQPAGVPTEAPAEQTPEPSTEALTEQAAKAPTESLAEQETELPAETAAEQETELPAETAAEQGTEPQAETLAGQDTEAPTETPTEQAAEGTTEGGTEQATEGRSEPPTAGQPEASTENADGETIETSAEMTFALSVRFSLRGCQLKLKEGQQTFAKSLFSEEEIKQGGQGNVIVCADPVDVLLKDEQEKGEEQKLTPEERSTREAEKEVLSQWAERNAYTVQQCFALRLKKGREGEETSGIGESREMLRMILEISGMPEDADEVTLVYVKDGETVIGEDLDHSADTITFDSRTFGTYALVYRTALPETESTTEYPQEETETETNTEKPAEESEENTEKQEMLVMEVAGGNAVYQPGAKGQWNPETHSYEHGTPGGWTFEDGEGKVTFQNTGTEDLTIVLSYHPSEVYEDIAGSFTDQEGSPIQELFIAAGDTAEAYLLLTGEPDSGMSGEVIGKVTYAVAEEGGN